MFWGAARASISEYRSSNCNEKEASVSETVIFTHDLSLSLPVASLRGGFLCNKYQFAVNQPDDRNPNGVVNILSIWIIISIIRKRIHRTVNCEQRLFSKVVEAIQKQWWIPHLCLLGWWPTFVNFLAIQICRNSFGRETGD